MTNKIEKEVLTTKNKQPIIETSYQDVYLLSNTFNQNQSWKETHPVLNNFFGNRVIPLNKKKIIKEFHANSYIFNVFYEDFLIRTDTLERQNEELKTRPKVRI